MKTLNRILVVFYFILSATVLFAEESSGRAPRHELGFGVAPLLGFAGSTTGGDLYTDLSGTLAISVSASYKYAILRHLQFGTSSTLGYIKTSVLGSTASATTVQVLAGPTLNIPFSSDWLYNSMYISTYGGFVDAASQTYGALEGTVGYRLGLAEHFCWSPSLGAYKVLNGSKFLFFVRPISFSILF